jgi:hypothetical protein
MLAPLYALSGRREVSQKWTMLLFNIAVLAGLLFYLSRRSRWLCASTALALLPFIYFEGRLLFWSWNPVPPLLATALAVTLTAGVCAGDAGALPWLIAVVSFQVQSHVGYAPVSLVLSSMAIAAVVWRLRSGDAGSRRAVTRSAIASALVGAALWMVPVVHDLRAPSSNLIAISRFVTTAHEPQPWTRAADIVAGELVATFDSSRELITGDVPPSTSRAVRVLAIAEIVLLACSVVWLHRLRRPFEAAFSLVCVLASCAGMFAVRSIVGDIHDYLVLWIGVIGTLNLAALVSTLGLTISGRSTPASSPDWRWRLAILVWIAFVAALGVSRLEWKQRDDSGDHTLLHLAADLTKYCDDHDYDRPLMTFDWKAWTAAAGLVLQLYKTDRTVAVADDALFMFGEPFAKTGAEPAELYLMPAEDDSLPPGITRYTWITTVGGYRLIQVFRN